MAPLVKKVPARKYDCAMESQAAVYSFCVIDDTVPSTNILLKTLASVDSSPAGRQQLGEGDFCAGWRSVFLKQGQGCHGLWALLPTTVSLLPLWGEWKLRLEVLIVPNHLPSFILHQGPC